MSLGADFLHFVDRVHAQHGYETDFWKLATSLDIPVTPGPFNSTVSLPRTVITLEEGIYHSPRTFVKMHEVSHALLRDSGIERELLHLCESPEEFRAQVEAYCNFGAGQLQMPEPVLQEALRRWGMSPEAVLQVAETSGASLAASMRRVVYGGLEPDAHRAAFVIRRNYVADVASANVPHTLSVGARVPEIALKMPTARLRQVPKVYGTGLTLGVVAW
ncbi:hypothetical protein SAMN04488058_101342 [Deinococcus reticulitermitis]|uniref:IrrE N-terminal-like domain-containing protein n=1 Tax=Deinococcus reticulitermitis TaxID=856736 RepID=A0A1H6SLN0_9DEIO|nr:hypothetical protein [Deinococcus reticulitermitis]SEI68681.1 hypothetical protein SAMN04488058_101342 [Deinococcus reticulitermitis]